MAVSNAQYFRTMVERINRLERGIPDDESANVSSYQYHIMRNLVQGKPVTGPDSLVTSASLVTMHGNHMQELSYVLQAFAKIIVTRPKFAAAVQAARSLDD